MHGFDMSSRATDLQDLAMHSRVQMISVKAGTISAASCRDKALVSHGRCENSLHCFGALVRRAIFAPVHSVRFYASKGSKIRVLIGYDIIQWVKMPRSPWVHYGMRVRPQYMICYMGNDACVILMASAECLMQTIALI